jgi:hypothetical protein
MFRLGFAPVACFAAAATLAAPLMAFEGQWHTGLSAGVVTTPSKVGPGGSGDGGYGIADALDVRLEAGAGRFAGDRASDSAVSTGLLFGGGAVLKFDVTHWVPYVALFANGLSFALAKTGPAGALLLQPGAGVNYMLSREHALGLEYRFALPIWGDYDTPYHQLQLRWEQRWGW